MKISSLYTPIEVAREVLSFGELKPGETVLDLGCGTGNFLFVAVKEFKARKAIGVEMQPTLVRTLRDRIHLEKYENKIEIVEGDLLEQNINCADLIITALYPVTLEKLQNKMEKELKYGTRILAPVFRFEGWKPIKEKRVQCNGFDNTIYLYQK